MTAEHGDGAAGMVYASYYPGPRAEVAREIILTRARALWRNAQEITDPAQRAVVEAEAWALRDRAQTPSRYSTAAQSERLRDRRLLGEDVPGEE